MNHSEPTARELFEILIREHGDALLASIRASVRASPFPLGGATHADDIFQETVLVAWRRLPDYDRSRPFGPWLRGIARLTALDLAGKHARMRVADPAVLDSVEREVASIERFRGSASEPSMSFRERMTALDNCLERLPSMYSATLQAVYRDTRSLAEIARSFDENEETIKKRLQRARALLATCLSRAGMFGPDNAGGDAEGEPA